MYSKCCRMAREISLEADILPDSDMDKSSTLLAWHYKFQHLRLGLSHSLELSERVLSIGMHQAYQRMYLGLVCQWNL